MKKEYINLVASGILALSLFAVAVVVGLKPADTALAGLQIPDVGVATTSASVSVTSSARILATTTNPLDPTNSFVRKATSICNTGTNPVYLLANGDKPVRFATTGTNSGVTKVIAAAAGYDACWTFTQEDFPYNGSITASSTNQTATVITVVDHVY